MGSDPVIGEGNAGIVAVAGRFLHRDIVYSQRDTRGPVALQLAGIVVVVDVQRLACEGFEGRSAFDIAVQVDMAAALEDRPAVAADVLADTDGCKRLAVGDLDQGRAVRVDFRAVGNCRQRTQNWGGGGMRPPKVGDNASLDQHPADEKRREHRHPGVT